MNWKTLVGWLLVAFGAVGLLSALIRFHGTSYGIGNLAGGILIVLGGVWLVRSSRPGFRS